MVKTVAIIQARMTSTRLPEKVLMGLAGIPVLKQVYNRACLIRGIDEVLVAIPDTSANDALVHFCEQNNIPVFRGSEDDVLDRYVQAGREAHADIVVRLTADNPFIDPVISSQVLDKFLSTGCDYVGIGNPSTYPVGLSTEVIRFSVLERIWKEVKSPAYREHVTLFIYQHPELFHIENVAYHTDLSFHRWTLDDKADYRMLSLVAEELKKRNQFGYLGEILAILQEHPEITRINKYKVIQDPKYGYLRVEPIPTQKEVDHYYQEEFFSANKPPNDSRLEVQQEEKEFFDSRWEDMCAKGKTHFGKVEGLSVLDIGCGFAQELLYLRNKGMIVSGIEPTPEGVKYAQEQGLQVYQSGIEDFFCVGDKRFDVVTLINVLEHLRNPANTLIDIKAKLLKPNGILVVDAPNEFNDFQTVANAEYNLNEWWVCPPNHINYFSATSLCHILDVCGYDIKYCESSFPIEMFLLMGDVYVGQSQLGKRCHQKRVKFEQLMRKHGKGDKLSRLYQELAKLDLGRQIIVYASPRKEI